MSEVKHSSMSSTPLQNVKNQLTFQSLTYSFSSFTIALSSFSLHFSSTEAFHNSIQTIPLNHPRHGQPSHQRPLKNLRPNLSATSSQATDNTANTHVRRNSQHAWTIRTERKLQPKCQLALQCYLILSFVVLSWGTLGG